ncbi:diadenylate cyclase CdaA [Haloplasma contractile]|uniref:Diadenylate cyclase n=1 Tax=Haloplasma contractile SSD-17B TaxID=1033810 RepID=F7PSB8_9MOLU|nr:diadenylate cyclase CdaA [Haloplasma contractile]ERJ10908.1 disA bacterial checkpoint controller nucleotide-binding family protein [Haloplasma contractile SSD-17B]
MFGKIDLDITAVFIAFVDLYFLWMILYFSFKFISYSHRAINIFKGILYLLIIYLVSDWLKLPILTSVFQHLVNYWFIILIVIFQPEIRMGFEKIGRHYSPHKTVNVETKGKAYIIEEIIKSCEYLSKRRIGALMTIERNDSLEDYIVKGTSFNVKLSDIVLNTIFIPSTPVHDGAVIIRGENIMCAGTYFPVSENDKVPQKLGTRHRAALGISEITDSLTIVISEESGHYTVAYDNNLDIGITKDSLRLYLEKYIIVKNTST